MRVERPVFSSLSLSKGACCQGPSYPRLMENLVPRDEETGFAMASLLFVGHFIMVTNASIGVAFSLDSILLTKSVTLKWVLHGVS